MKFNLRQPKSSKQKKTNRSHIPFRLNLLFFIVFISFVILIFRLGYLQIIRGEEFVAEVNRTETTLATGNVPRGEIYDSKERKLVENNAHSTITYTRGPDVNASDMAVVADRLAGLISMPHVTEFENERDYDISKRDLADYFIATHQDEINDRLTAQERTLSGSEAYDAQLDKVQEAEIAAMDEHAQQATNIFKQMNAGYALNTVNIKKEGVQQDEIARVSERLSDLPGVGTGTDWTRSYPYQDMLRSILGSVSSEEQGLPEDELNAYLARGYARNDRVGQSYLEREYEQVLAGTKSRSHTEVNQNGEIINQEEQYPGSKGNNLVLTIDTAFQDQVEQIARDSLARREGLNDSVYIVALDPQTGDVLAMTGQTINERGEIQDDALGTFTKNFVPGSSIKPATIAAGYMDGVLEGSGNYMVDEPLIIQGTPPIRSVFNRAGSVTLDEVAALEVSSNIYMAKIAMRMGGVTSFENGGTLDMDGQMVLNKLRGYFAQFGLGVPTGIDLPGEQTGYQGSIASPGEVLYYSFGNYDSFTTLQLAQYIATIANNGGRMAPRLVKEIRGTNEDGSLGPVLKEMQPRLMNTVGLNDEELNQIKSGLYAVTHGRRGTAYDVFNSANVSYDVAGKTGTAEAFYYGIHDQYRGDEVSNETFVGYAPADDPQIAIAVVIPYLPNTNNNRENLYASKEVFDAFFRQGKYEELADEYADNLEEETAEGEAAKELEKEAEENGENEEDEDSSENDSSEADSSQAETTQP